MSIHRLMNMGTRAMQGNQTALQTVGHNISNANTEGYSKQKVEMVAEAPFTYGNLIIGDGATIRGIRRSHDSFLTKQINKETEMMGQYNSKSEFLDTVEAVFNETLEDGLSSNMSKFFNELRKLSNNPESSALRTSVIDSVNALAKDFNRVGNGLDKVQRSIDAKLELTIENVNSILKEVVDLNKNISKLEIAGHEANDLRDRRDLLVKRLSNEIDIQTVEDDRTGMISITMASSATILNGTDTNKLSLHRLSSDAGQGLVRVVMQGRSSDYDITDQIKRGTMSGAFDVRDKIIPNIREKLENMTYSFANKANEIYSKGYDNEANTGMLLFEKVDGSDGILGKIKMASYLTDSPSRLAVASAPFQPANNEIALELTNLQRERFVKDMIDQPAPAVLMNEDGSIVPNPVPDGSTMNDFYGAIISDLGIKTREARNLTKHQEGVVEQLNKFRESISGVSLDEEGVDLIKYQRAFEAASKMIKVADELLETIMSLKRF